MADNNQSSGCSVSFEQYFRRKPAPARIGVFAAGLATYWPQFDGLKEQLMEYHAELIEQLKALDVEVIDAGLSDTVAAAGEVADKLIPHNIDLLICNVFTYTTSSNVVQVIQRFNCPVVLVGLQPDAALNYSKATTYDQLRNDNVTSLSEICCALQRSGIEVADIIFGKLHDDPRAKKRLNQWADISRVLHILPRAHIGLMGHTYEGMLDMNSDPTMFTGRFGMHIEHIELDDLQQRVDSTSEQAVDDRLTLINEIFHFPDPGSDPIAGLVDPDELRWAAKVSVAMDQLVVDFKLDGLAYYYRGLAKNANERLGCSLIIGSSLLTGRGVPIAGEYDVKNCVAMLIMDRLGAGGSFAELHPADFTDDLIMVGHDGPHHIAIAEGKPKLRGLTVLHGKRGGGPSVEFAIKHGPITMLAISQTYDGRFKFIVAEGQSVAGEIPATGNTNTRCRFKPDVRTFVERWSMAGPTHHLALGHGLHAETIEKLAKVLAIECQIIAVEA